MSDQQRRAGPGASAYFTDREVAVIGWLAADSTVPDIARRLGVSVATVQVHLAAIRTKALGSARAEVPADRQAVEPQQSAAQGLPPRQALRAVS